MPRSSKIAPIAEEYDENEPDFEGEDSDDWQPEPEVSCLGDFLAFSFYADPAMTVWRRCNYTH